MIHLLLPILLIHGYSENASIWNQWISPNMKAITFTGDDRCGTVEQHAADLARQIGSADVDIIAHSKGGLDARYFISHYPNHVHKLIMIGTPNEGTPASYQDLTSCVSSDNSADSISNMQPDSTEVLAPDSHSVKYFAIAGNDSEPCNFVGGYRALCDTSDGFVTVESALSHYPGAVFFHNHVALTSARDVFLRTLYMLN